MPEMRWCPGIVSLGIEGHLVPLADFYRHRNQGRQRIDSSCKECRKARTADWRRRNRQKRRDYANRYNAENRERIRTYQREFYRFAYGKGLWVWKRYRVEYEVDRLPIQPFRDWLDRNVAPILATKEEIRQAMGETTRRGHDAMAGLITWTAIAKKIDVDPKTLPNYTSGKTRTVPREVVDRMGLLFGHMDLSDELYEDQLEESA